MKKDERRKKQEARRQKIEDMKQKKEPAPDERAAPVSQVGLSGWIAMLFAILDSPDHPYATT